MRLSKFLFKNIYIRTSISPRDIIVLSLKKLLISSVSGVDVKFAQTYTLSKV